MKNNKEENLGRGKMQKDVRECNDSVLGSSCSEEKPFIAFFTCVCPRLVCRAAQTDTDPAH